MVPPASTNRRRTGIVFSAVIRPILSLYSSGMFAGCGGWKSRKDPPPAWPGVWIRGIEPPTKMSASKRASRFPASRAGAKTSS